MRLKIAGRGQQAQRPACRIALLLRVALPIRHRRAPRLCQLLRIKFELARGGAKFLATFRSDVDRPAAKYFGQIEPCDRSGGAAPQLFDRRLGLHAEHRVGETHSPRQFLRQPEI